MSSRELFQAGRLADAVDAQTQVVKMQPANVAERVFLFELLSFQDEFDRADRQLEAVSKLDIQQDLAVQPYRNLLAAEKQRLKLFREGVPPVVPGEAPPRLYHHLQAVICLRHGAIDEAQQHLTAGEDEFPSLSVNADGETGGDFRDCDDVCASFIEFFVGPEYLWIPMEQIRSMQMARPERPRDLLWSQSNLMLVDGTLLRGYVPVRYVDSGQASRDALKLGHETEWSEAESGPIRGTGQRMCVIGDESRAWLDFTMLSVFS